MFRHSFCVPAPWLCQIAELLCKGVHETWAVWNILMASTYSTYSSWCSILLPTGTIAVANCGHYARKVGSGEYVGLALAGGQFVGSLSTITGTFAPTLHTTRTYGQY